MLYKHKIKFIPVLTMVAVIAATLSMNTSKAASVGVIDLLLTNQNISVASNQTISFYNQSVVAEGNTIILTFAAAFDTSTITEDDVDVEDDGVDLTTAADCSGTEQASVAMASDVLTITICAGDGGAIAGSSRIDVKIGTNATASGTGVNQIINPSTVGTYTVALTGTFGDTGSANVVIIAPASVTITATVDPIITFSINNTVCNLGNLNAATAGTCTYTISHSTNAQGGLVVKASAPTTLTRIGGSETIPYGTGSIVAGTAEYGFWVSTPDGGSTVTGYSAEAQPVPSSATTIIENAIPHASASDVVTHKAAVSGLTAAGSYIQTITWTATATF